MTVGSATIVHDAYERTCVYIFIVRDVHAMCAHTRAHNTRDTWAAYAAVFGGGGDDDNDDGDDGDDDDDDVP